MRHRPAFLERRVRRRKSRAKNYVAGDTVEFDVAGEEEMGNGRQMELF